MEVVMAVSFIVPANLSLAEVGAIGVPSDAARENTRSRSARRLDA